MNEIKIRQLKTSMELLETQATYIKEAREKFELTLTDQISAKKTTEADILMFKADLEAEALEEFKKTGSKKLLGGIGIREGSVMTYYAKEALKFAKEKNMFLQLDKKAFEKVATSLNLDFVTTTPKTTVTFPKVVKL